MGCCLPFGNNNNNKPIIEITDETPKGKEFDYLRPEDKIIYGVDTTYDVPRIDIDSNGWYMNSVRLWHKSKKVRPHFLMLRNTPSVSPQISFSSDICDSRIDTAF